MGAAAAAAAGVAWPWLSIQPFFRDSLTPIPGHQRHAPRAPEGGCRGEGEHFDTSQRPFFVRFWREFLVTELPMTKQRKSPFLTIAEAADLLRLKKHTLDNMRWQGTGPPFRKHGGRIFYHRDELNEWSKSGRRKSSSGRKR